MKLNCRNTHLHAWHRFSSGNAGKVMSICLVFLNRVWLVNMLSWLLWIVLLQEGFRDDYLKIVKDIEKDNKKCQVCWILYHIVCFHASWCLQLPKKLYRFGDMTLFFVKCIFVLDFGRIDFDLLNLSMIKMCVQTKVNHRF